MNKPLQAFFSFLLLTCSLVGHAQTHTIQGATNFNKRGLTPIYDGYEVKGYTMFYRVDQADKKNDNYGLDFYDQDLQKAKSVMMQKERYNTHLLRNAYNGEAFCFYFYNPKKKTFELDVFDKSLSKIGSKTITGLTNGDINVGLQELQSPGNGENKAMGGLNLFSVPSKGFLRNSYLGLMKGYSLEMYDNKLNLLWMSKSDEKSKEYETLLVNEVTEKYILATIARRPGMMSKQLTFSMAAIDVNTGEKIFDLPIETDKDEQLSISSFSYDETTSEFIAMGEFYALKDKPMINKSQGFFVKRFGADGKEKSKKFYSWAKDINPLLPQQAKKSVDEGFVNFVHKIVRGADGKQHIIAEQYKVKADGVGIALAVMGGGTSTVKSIIGNMLIFSLAKDHTLEKVSFFGKDQTDFLLPAGSGWYGAGMIGLVINTIGGFDYQFTQLQPDQTSFNTAYLNYKDVKNSKFDEKTLVNIMHSGQDAPVTDRISLKSGKGVRSFVYPAKPGYVLVLNRLSEERKLEMNLVKLNK